MPSFDMGSQGQVHGQGQGQGRAQGGMAPPGPPYPPQTAGLGGLPVPNVDDPVSGVVIALFIGAAVIHMTIFQINQKRSHKFVLSGLCFGLCMARIVANVLRIAWASYPQNTRLAVAAGVFSNAGVVILFIVNLIFAQRILRSYHPRFGWSRPATFVFRFLYVSIGLNLVLLILAVVYSVFTLDQGLLLRLPKIQLFAVTYYAFLAFLPIPIVILSILYPRKAPMDKFGQGRMRTKVRLLLFTAFLLSFGAGFRTGVFYDARPANKPAWFHHKACYYCFNYVIELIVVYTYALSRFDRRFHIPDGSSAPGHYSRGFASKKSLSDHVNTEEEVLGDDERPPTVEEEVKKERSWESRLQNELEKRDEPV